ncbi:MAG: hypothetical protein K6T31_03730, partial [Alicyclobacillus sp.]|nr:hypothetical protein [Alicyclobacillus sp.]
MNKLRVVATALLSGALLMAASIQPAYAYIARTDNPPRSEGSYNTNDQITGGDVFYITNTTYPTWSNQNYLMNQRAMFKFAADGVTLINGNDTSGGIWHFDQVQDANGQIIDRNNGYLEIGPSALSQWTTALKGNAAYVGNTGLFGSTAALPQTTFMDEGNSSNYGATWTVYDFTYLVHLSGGMFQPGDPMFNHTVYASDPPTAQITWPNGKSVPQGTDLPFNIVAIIGAYNTATHYEYLQVTGVTDGKDYTVQAGLNAPLQGSLGAGEDQPMYLQTSPGSFDTTKPMQEVVGGGPSTPGSPNTITNGMTGMPNAIKTTSLPPGQYKITLWVTDYVGRQSQPFTDTFTVQPAACSFGVSVQSTSSGSAQLLVSDPLRHSIQLSPSAGSLSQAIVTSSTGVTLYGQPGQTITVTATDQNSPSCPPVSVTVTLSPVAQCPNNLTATTSNPQTGPSGGTLIKVSGDPGTTYTLTASGHATFTTSGTNTATVTISSAGYTNVGITDNTAETMQIGENGASNCITLTFTFPTGQQCGLTLQVMNQLSSSATLNIYGNQGDTITLQASNGSLSGYTVTLTQNTTPNQSYGSGWNQVTVYGGTGTTTITATDTQTGCVQSTSVTWSGSGSGLSTTSGLSAVVSDQYTQEMGSGATGSGTLGPTVTVATGQSVTFNV